MDTGDLLGWVISGSFGLWALVVAALGIMVLRSINDLKKEVDEVGSVLYAYMRQTESRLTRLETKIETKRS